MSKIESNQGVEERDRGRLKKIFISLLWKKFIDYTSPMHASSDSEIRQVRDNFLSLYSRRRIFLNWKKEADRILESYANKEKKVFPNTSKTDAQIYLLTDENNFSRVYHAVEKKPLPLHLSYVLDALCIDTPMGGLTHQGTRVSREEIALAIQELTEIS